MGKHPTSVPGSCLPTQTGNPNHKWVRMFNVLDHHRWNNVKKMLTTSKKHGEDKQSTGVEGHHHHGNPAGPPPLDPGAGNLPNEEKTKESSSNKKGRAAKLRAMITKDMISRRKGKHRRSSTCPGSSELGEDHDPPTHNRYPSAGGKRGHPPTTNHINHTKHTNPSIVRESNGNFYPKEYEYLFARISQKCHLCRTHRPDGHTHCGDSKEQQLGADMNNVVQENKNDEPQVLEGEPSKVDPDTSRPFYRSATFHQSKELLDAMDLLSLNKDFFLKVLEDPESSLSQHFMAQQASGMRKRLDKSGTFPRPSSSPTKRGPSPSALMGIRKLSFKENNQNLNAPPLNNLLDNQQSKAGTHFKDLRQRIKHVIKESKKERLRVAMDAVLHKVPYGRQYFENGRDVSNQLKSDMDKEDVNSSANIPASPFKKDKWKVARSSSFHDSMERYNKLFEISYQRELKNSTSDHLKLKKDEETRTPARRRRELARISSSPNLGRFPHKDSNMFSHHAVDFTPSVPLVKDENKNVSEQNAKVLPPPSIQQGRNDEKLSLEVEGVPNHDQGVTTVVSSDEKASLRVQDSDYDNKGKATGPTGTPMERIEEPICILDHHLQKDSTFPEKSLGGMQKSGDDSVDKKDGTCSDMVDSEKATEDYSFQLSFGTGLESLESEKDKDDSSDQYQVDGTCLEMVDSRKAEEESSNPQGTSFEFVNTNVHLVDSEKTEEDSSSQHDSGHSFEWLDFDPKAEDDSSDAQPSCRPLDMVEETRTDEEVSSNQRWGTDLEKVEKDGGAALKHDSPADYNRQVHVDSKDQADFNYVKDILHLSGYSGSQILGTWSSSDQPVNPSLFSEMESCTTLQEPQFLKHDHEESTSNHLLLFDLINEVLLETYERSVTYWNSPLTNCSRIHPMPKGHHVLEEVWANVSWYLGSSQEDTSMSLEFLSMRDLAKDDGWMNLQLEAEYVTLELEGLIFEDLLEEFGSS